MNQLVRKLPDFKDDPEQRSIATMERSGSAERTTGAALRALRQLLDDKDSRHDWGGLSKVLTPEDHYLWLCEYHAQEYAQ